MNKLKWKEIGKAAFWIFIGAAVGCGGGGSSATASAPAPTLAQFNALQDQVTKLSTAQAATAAETTTNTNALKQVRIFGGTASTSNANAVRSYALRMGDPKVLAALDFGNSGCTNIGQHTTNGGSDTSNAAYSQYVGYVTCKGIYFNVSYIDGTLDKPQFLFWDDDTCGASGGNMFLGTSGAGIAGFGQFALNNGGVAFQIPGNTTVYLATVGNGPVSTPVRSMFNYTPAGGTCGPAIETIMALPVQVNSLDSTGVLNQPYPTDIVSASAL